MSAFYLWSPSISDNQKNAVELFVTRGDNGAIANGTIEFAQEILESIGVTGNVKSWKVAPFRSSYFSEYVGEPDWRDTWQLVWKIQIEINRPVESLPQLKSGSIGTDAGDDSWTPSKRPKDDAAVNCLVIGDFRTSKAREAAREAILGSEPAGNRVSPPMFHNARILGKYEQLQIDMGPFPGNFYADGAAYAEAVMDICKRFKGTVHFQQHPK